MMVRLSVLMLLLSVIVPLSISPRWVEALEGIERSRVRLVMLLAVPLVFMGGRLHFLLNNWDFVVAGGSLTLATFCVPSLHAGGAIAALAIGLPLVVRLLGIPVGKFFDGIAPACGIGIAIARLGCFLQGCCFGSVCHWPWCITFPKSTYIYTLHEASGVLPAEALRSAPVHPLQLYFAAGGLMLTAVALWMHGRKRYDGEVGLVTLFAYGVSAAVLEFYRAEYHPRPYWGPLPQLEWMALAITAGAGLALVLAERSHRRRMRRREPCAMASSTDRP
jgi:phosphatidylglycerol:prolipoprotein diacylglycerol transferase